ncbi:OmpA family protein [Falsirhodobacter deserti]|uniref:OmpA family protein n=1 Tax=Falsirhodobacter deserti TaxID=1365611 RepID=UPI000FE407C7|nr:OmpA family protein [Falsirhodobacter deserti]
MRLSRKIIVPAMFIGAAAVAAGGATVASGVIEERSESAVAARLAQDGITFATVEADGLNVHLSGTAPDEATRFRAINLAGSVVDPSRLRDDMTVLPTRAVEAPQFEMELLRNDDGVSLIGLIPRTSQAMMADTAALVPDLQVSDMLETADHPAPDGWNGAMAFGIDALKLLPRAKISVAPGVVTITAIANDVPEQQRLRSQLAQITPAGVKANVDITAPRPVITPYALRLIRNEDGTRFESCSAPDEDQAERIVAAAQKAGAADAITCAVGLGAPSAEWTAAAEAGIEALAALPAGSLTMSDADIVLAARAGTPRADFDRVAGSLDTSLPAGFSLQTVLPPAPAEEAEGPLEFTAELTPDGEATIAGRVRDALGQEAVTSYARARFGANAVTGTPVLDESAPTGWTTRVMTGLEALDQLASGSLRVTPKEVTVSGVTGSKAAQAQITQLLTEKLGNSAFTVTATYDEDLDPYAALPAPEECMANIRNVMAQQKISFAPGSAEIEGSARATLDGLTEILTDCANLSFEIQGYTDSQGSDAGNQALSQARAEAVMVALQGRRISADRLTAVGYGEADPIADNTTEEGRESNRRIEFKLTHVAPDPNAPPPAQGANARQAMLAIARIDAFLLPQGDWYDSIPADMVDGSGDDTDEGEEVDGEPSFAPTEMTGRAEARPDDL